MGLSAWHALVPVEAVLIIKPLTGRGCDCDLDFEDRFFADLGLVGARSAPRPLRRSVRGRAIAALEPAAGRHSTQLLRFLGARCDN